MKAHVELLPDGVRLLIQQLQSVLKISAHNVFITFSTSFDESRQSSMNPVYDKTKIELLSFTDQLDQGPIAFCQMTSDFFNIAHNREYLQHNAHPLDRGLYERFDVIGCDSPISQRGNSVVFHIPYPQQLLQHLKTIYSETEENGLSTRLYKFCTISVAYIPTDPSLVNPDDNATKAIGIRVTGSQLDSRTLQKHLQQGLAQSTLFLQQYHPISLLQKPSQSGIIDQMSILCNNYIICRSLSLRSHCVKIFSMKLTQSDTTTSSASSSMPFSHNKFAPGTSSSATDKKHTVLSLLRRFVEIAPNFTSTASSGPGIGSTHFLRCTIDLAPFFTNPSFVARNPVSHSLSKSKQPDSLPILNETTIKFIIQTDLIESEISFDIPITARLEFLDDLVQQSQTEASDLQTSADYYIKPAYVPLLCALQHEAGDFRFEIYDNMFSGFCRDETELFTTVCSFVAPLTNVYE